MLSNILKIFKKKVDLEIEDSNKLKKKDSEFQNRARGSLYGLAIGDALGAPLEFLVIAEDDAYLTDYVTGGKHRVKKGEYTDDTSMALALTDSLLTDGFNLESQLDNYVLWQTRGKYSSRGYCFDIGISTSIALNKYKLNQKFKSVNTDSKHSGNGSLMRLAPVPLFYFKYGIEEMVNKSVDSSLTTHGSDVTLDCIKYFVVIYNKILKGEKDKDKLIKLTEDEMAQFNIRNLTLIELLHELDFKSQKIKKLKTDGFVLYSLILSLYCFYYSDDFEDAVLEAVNLGGDADTNGAITGQLAGAYYGYNSIPEKFINGLNPKKLLDTYFEPFVDRLEENES